MAYKVIRTTGDYRLYLTLTRGTPNIAGNYTPVTVRLYLYKNSGTNWAGLYATDSRTWSWSGSGITARSGSYVFDFRGSLADYGEILLRNETFNVAHNSDGSRGNLTVSATVNFAHSSIANSVSISETLSFTTIPRASSFTLSGSTQTGSDITVTITRAVSSFTHRVRWRIGSGAWTNSATAATTSASVTVPHTAIPNNASATVTIAVQTFSGTTAIGSEVSASRTLTVPTSVIPTISAITATENVSEVATKVGAFVKGKSKLNLAITGANGVDGSTITGYKITLTGTTINASSGVSNLVTVSGDVVITGTVTDSRGRTASKTLTINVLDYVAPTLTGLSFHRSTSDGVTDPTGTYVTVKGTVNVSSLMVGTTQKNQVSYDAQHDKSGSFVSFITESPDVITKAYTDILPAFTIDKIFNFRSRAGDIFGYGGWSVGVVPSGEVTQQWGRKTTSFGKMIDDPSYNIQAGSGGIDNDGNYHKNGVDIFKLIYPVGAIYISVSSTNPSSLFGGSWSAFGTGRTLVGVDTGQTEFDTVQKTGGHKSLQAHTHSVSGTAASAGAHTHTVPLASTDAGSANYGRMGYQSESLRGATGSAGAHTHSVSGTANTTGGGNAQNLQPYITVFMWRRTA